MTLKITSALALGVAIGLTFTPAISFAASKKLTGDEIKAEFSGKSHTATGRHWAGNVTHKSNGTLSGYDTKGKAKFTGTWSVKGNKYCWKSKPSGWKGCGSVKVKSDGKIKVSGYATLTRK